MSYRMTHIPLTDQSPAISKGYVWQSPAGQHRGIRNPARHKHAKSVGVYLDKGLLCFSGTEPGNDAGGLPVFTGDAWWDK